MTGGRVPLFGWGAFLLLAIAASLVGTGVQVAFAALAVGVLGLPHGASDLTIVAPGRRQAFLAAYVGTIGAVLSLWIAAPIWGLSVLLACSAVHFALDDEDHGPFGWARGACLVAAPAVVHRDALADLFARLTRSTAAAGDIASLLQVAGVLGLAIVVGGLVHRRVSPANSLTVAALVAAVALPPLTGFAVGFVMLHAWRQTQERRDELRCPTMGAYLLRVAPVLAGAAVVLLGIATTLAGRLAGDVGILFAGIAALAMPHMLVTPIWHRRPAPLPLRRRPRGGVAIRL
ncbi:Brp/Blh family beta-carotene 15,15'-dioxygenase [Sphingomonas bacterium]|uniref:Brp/Blh family beta-carotene 15,15'-dioxygenase n=1 Tax=Sphingomonas bacterium TaxID=1895847 RepID=UPI0015757ACA|nr:Brp/Blh family beta-carotene 15,15'-dioxygenase [Sphingomonas bacterium]